MLAEVIVTCQLDEVRGGSNESPRLGARDETATKKNHARSLNLFACVHARLRVDTQRKCNTLLIAVIMFSLKTDSRCVAGTSQRAVFTTVCFESHSRRRLRAISNGGILLSVPSRATLCRWILTIACERSSRVFTILQFIERQKYTQHIGLRLVDDRDARVSEFKWRFNFNPCCREVCRLRRYVPEGFNKFCELIFSAFRARLACVTVCEYLYDFENTWCIMYFSVVQSFVGSCLIILSKEK